MGVQLRRPGPARLRAGLRSESGGVWAWAGWGTARIHDTGTLTGTQRAHAPTAPQATLMPVHPHPRWPPSHPSELTQRPIRIRPWARRVGPGPLLSSLSRAAPARTGTGAVHPLVPPNRRRAIGPNRIRAWPVQVSLLLFERGNAVALSPFSTGTSRQ
jgi:hypothetical protein